MAKKQAAPLKATAPPKPDFKVPGWLLPAVILLVSFLVYVNTLGLQYALDDSIVITDNQYTQQGFAGISDIFSHDSFTGFFGEDRNPVEGGRYRPLSIASFAVEHGIMGRNNPFVSHLLNVLLFSLTCLLLFRLLQKVIGSGSGIAGIPFLATLLFAVHPIHTEAVANIKGRDEIFALLFSFTAFLFSLDYAYRKGIWRLALSFLFFSLALFSKESALPLLLLLPLTLFVGKNKTSLGSAALATVPLLVATILYLFARHEALKGIPPPDPGASSDLLNDAYKFATGEQRIGTALYCLAWYVKLLFIPWPLTNDYYPYQVSLVGISNPVALLGGVIYLGLIVMAVIGILKKQVYGWAIAFYLLTLALVSNIVIDIGVFMAERFLFLPSVGFCVAIACVLHKLFAGKKTAIYVLSPVLLVFAVLTLVRNPVWKDNATLFITDVDNSPNSAKALTAGAAEKWKAAREETNQSRRNKLLSEALAHIDKAVKIHPTHAVAWDIRGHILIDYKKDYAGAVASYEKAVSFNQSPNYVRNLAIGYNLAKDFQKSADNFRKYLEKKPNDPGGWFDLGLALENGTQYQQAVDAYLRCTQLDPKNAEAMGKIGMIYGRYLGQTDNAIEYLESALKAGGKQEETYNNLGIAYGMKQDYAKSAQVLEEGLRAFPNSKQIMPSLVITYRSMGDSAKMRDILQKMQPR